MVVFVLLSAQYVGTIVEVSAPSFPAGNISSPYSVLQNVMIRQLISPNADAQPGGGFGFSVAASGSIVVVGAGAETAGGHAYMFKAQTGALISTLTSPNPQSGGGFGFSVAASSSIVVVGAATQTANGQPEAGHAYTFNATTGGLISTLTSPNPQRGGFFGSSVAASGYSVVVGAAHETADGQQDAGHAYTFNATTGALISTIISPNVQRTGSFGSSVATSGNIIVVGAGTETADGLGFAGHAYTFNATTGALISTLTSPNAQSGGVFGTSVAASDNIVVVGAVLENVNGQSAAGHAYAFDAGTGALISTLTSPNVDSYSFFGLSVATKGNILVVGAPSETASGQLFAGHVYTFNVETGALISTLTSPNPQSGGGFGFSVAATGNILGVGAPFEKVNGQIAGQAYTSRLAPQNLAGL